MEEIWKRYRDTRYDVSNLGRVRSTSRPDALGHSRRKQAGVMVQKLTKRGYNQVCIAGKWTAVHRMVAETFIGKPENDKMVVDHINNTPTDNRVTNLQWLTPAQNINKAHADGLVPKWAPEHYAKISEIALRNNENRKIPIEVTDKRTNETKVFRSSIEASEYYGRYKGYFREVVTKKHGENKYFIVRDLPKSNN